MVIIHIVCISCQNIMIINSETTALQLSSFQSIPWFWGKTTASYQARRILLRWVLSSWKIQFKNWSEIMWPNRSSNSLLPPFWMFSFEQLINHKASNQWYTWRWFPSHKHKPIESLIWVQHNPFKSPKGSILFSHGWHLPFSSYCDNSSRMKGQKTTGCNSRTTQTV